MDELDRKIMALLQADGRTSNARISRHVGVSEGTIRRRLKHLLEEGIIHVVAIPEPERLGFATEALIGVQVEPDKIDSVAEGLGALPEAQWVAVTTGAYDIFTWVIVRSAEELGSFLRAKVGPISGVRRTETFVSLTLKKRNMGLPLLPDP